MAGPLVPSDSAGLIGGGGVAKGEVAGGAAKAEGEVLDEVAGVVVELEDQFVVGGGGLDIEVGDGVTGAFESKSSSVMLPRTELR